MPYYVKVDGADSGFIPVAEHFIDGVIDRLLAKGSKLLLSVVKPENSTGLPLRDCEITGEWQKQLPYLAAYSARNGYALRLCPEGPLNQETPALRGNSKFNK